MQNRWKFNNIEIAQPDSDGANVVLATTSTEDSDRSMLGRMHNTPLFTVLGYDFKWTNIKATDAAVILRQFTGKNKCLVHYFDPLTAKWKDDYFYASNFNAPSLCMKEGKEYWRELTFDIRGSDAV